MRNRLAGVALCVVLSACGSSDDDAGDDQPAAGASGKAANASGSGGSGGKMATGTGGSPVMGMGLKGEQWPAPGPNCGSFGKPCENGCEAASCDSFQSELCFPPLKAAITLMCSPGSCASDEPFCVGTQCMTAEQATCVCAQPEAQKRLDVCRGGPDAARGMCLSDQAICAGATDNCCDGLVCLQVPGVIAQCAQPCVENTECASGCCADVGAPHKICGPGEVCGIVGPGGDPGGDAGIVQRCGQTGESCEGMPCCDGMSCFDSDNPDFDGCRPTCTSETDCESGCCWPPGAAAGGECVNADYCGEPCSTPVDCTTNCCVIGTAGSTDGRCAPAKTCSTAMCLQADAPCGSDDGALCCEGLACVGFGDSPLTCVRRCTTSAECASGCCNQITGSSTKVCNATGPAC